MPPLSLIAVLSELPDPRHCQGKVHPLPAVLSLVVLGLLMGRKSLSSIARLGRLYGTPLAHALGFRRGKTPCKSTLSEILRALDADYLETLLSRWVCSRLGKIETLAMDGKTLRGSRDGEVPGQHLVAAYAGEVEAVVAQIRVDSKTNEHKAALQLLGVIDVKDKLITGDAMFCQRDLAGQIIDQGGDYLLVVKDNQEGLKIDISAGFGYGKAAEAIHVATGGKKTDPEKQTPRHAKSSDKAHGRQEIRELWTTGILTLHEKWPGMKQGLKIRRVRKIKGKVTEETVYGITSLTPEKADAKKLLGLLREHWRIENCLHYVRDVTLGEDASRVRTGSAPQILAGLRNAVVHLIRSVDAESRPDALEQLAARPNQAMELIGLDHFQ